jgi:membrane protease YdiL (CAAX protease family)
MNETVDTKRIAIYLAFAFGIAWSVGLVIYLTGGLSNSPPLVTGTPITLALALLITVYMGAPALAHVLTRVLTREGWRDTTLRPQFRRGWPYWVAAWFSPGILTILGGVVYFALFPGYFDPTFKVIRDLLARSPQPLPISPALLVVLQIVQAMAIAPLVNSLFTFGEEFGWRAYLQPRLMPLGERRAFVLMGVIWGVWHWPVIAMGYNYGADYPGAPWLGMLGMVWFTLLVGTLIGWLALRGGSVWPAVIGHAAVNGIAGLAMLFVQGKPNLLVGPTPLGVVGSAAWAAVALWILIRQPGKPADQ